MPTIMGDISSVQAASVPSAKEVGESLARAQAAEMEYEMNRRNLSELHAYALQAWNEVYSTLMGLAAMGREDHHGPSPLLQSELGKMIGRERAPSVARPGYVDDPGRNHW